MEPNNHIVLAHFAYQYLDHDLIKAPAYDSRGLDLFFDIERNFSAVPGATYEVSTGLTLCPVDSAPVDTLILPRSSAGKVNKNTEHFDFNLGKGVIAYATTNIRLSNTVGLIDRDYRGPLIIRFEVSKKMVIQRHRSYFQAYPVGGNNPQYRIVDSMDQFRATSRGSKWDGSSDSQTEG